MNKKLGLAVAGALLAASASAQAGISIPAGDWTVDIGGNVNAFYTNVDSSIDTKLAGVKQQIRDPKDSNTIGTGLLPAQFGIGAKTRQNDLDIAFQFSFFTGTAAGQRTAGDANTLNIRQAYLTFGDASWGTVKMGRDLGVFGSDAILSDMTLLGVGVGGPAGGSSTLGRIGSGYIYADWKGQIAYTSPNWNGLQLTAAAVEGWTNGAANAQPAQKLGFEGKATYDFKADDVSGRVWTSVLSQKHEGDSRAANVQGANTFDSYTSRGWDLGARVNVSSFGLVGYFYDGRGLDSQGTTAPVTNAGLSGLTTGGLQFLGGQKTDDRGGYVQGTWTIPTGTKLGLSWGRNRSESDVTNPAVNVNNFKIENESWMIGAYHPLTKSLNLVAEYVDQNIEGTSKNVGAAKDKVEIDNKTISLGAILFF